MDFLEHNGDMIWIRKIEKLMILISVSHTKYLKDFLSHHEIVEVLYLFVGYYLMINILLFNPAFLAKCA